MAQQLMLMQLQLLRIKDQLLKPLPLVMHLMLMVPAAKMPKVQVTSILPSNMTISTMDGMRKTNSRFEVQKVRKVQKKK
jgi:hypothetical protein